MTAEVDRLRSVQRECAAAAIASATEREREFAMLGVSDYLVEELIVMYWSDAIRTQSRAVLHMQQECGTPDNLPSAT
jgi:hypothetical protein